MAARTVSWAHVPYLAWNRQQYGRCIASLVNASWSQTPFSSLNSKAHYPSATRRFARAGLSAEND